MRRRQGIDSAPPGNAHRAPGGCKALAVEHAVALREAGLLDRELVLGRYRPLRPLGSGGSGSVWLVRDEHAARDVALKVVPREGKAGSRAEREVEAATRLRHPHCLRALALDRDDRHVYVAYPYVHGHTLRELLRGGRLDDATAVEAGAQVLEALAHAHAKGVVHRDVKPANVILEEGETVSVRLLDFGLARIDHADTLTAVGDVPGTLGYIAPERLAGAEATGAADVWAVGVLLWEALAGRHPFWAISPLETARRVEAGAPPPSLPSSALRVGSPLRSPCPFCLWGTWPSAPPLPTFPWRSPGSCSSPATHARASSSSPAPSSHPSTRWPSFPW